MDRLKYPTRIQLLIVTALGCCACSEGFAQLIYLTDSRSLTGSASILDVGTNTTSYSPFSGSAAPSAPFTDFQGDVSGTATYVNETLPTPYTESATISSQQNSFLHPQELYFSSGEYGYSGTGSYAFAAQGSSSLQVTFQVSSPVFYNLSVRNEGDPLGGGASVSLSSSSQGTLYSENYQTKPEQEWNVTLYSSGTFTPGNVYTLDLDSSGGNIEGQAPPYYDDGAGLLVDLTVPEPSMTAFAGLAFLIFLLRAHKIKQRAVQGSCPKFQDQ